MSKLDQTPGSGPQLVTQAAYAASRKARGLSGGTREAVRQAVEAGRISVIGPDKLVDPVVADIQWERNSRRRTVGVNVKATAVAEAGPSLDTDAIAQPAPAQAPAQPAQATLAAAEGAGKGDGAHGGSGAIAGGAGAGGGYADARTRREQADALTAEIRARQAAKQLVDRARVELAVRDAFAVLRNRIMSVPRQTAASIVGMTDLRTIEQRIESDLRDAFGSFEQKMLETIESRITQ